MVTINFNNAAGLARTLASVTAQSFADFEQIVVDGGSSDESLQILQSDIYRVDRCISESDRGIYHAMNKGVRLARGKYLLFVNSGDHLKADNSLGGVVEKLGNSDLHYTSLEIVRPVRSGHKATTVREYPKNLTLSFFAETSLPHPATFIKSELFERFGLYDETLKVVADWRQFMLWVCKYNCTYSSQPEVTSVFYEDGVSSSANSRSIIAEERGRVMRAEFPAILSDILELQRLRREEATVRALFRSGRIRFLQSINFLPKL